MIEKLKDPAFVHVPNDAILWQYMSLTKFLYLIKFRKLHFHRLDDLNDEKEGVLSEVDKQSLPFHEDTTEWNEYLENDRKRAFVSCWINNPIETSQMWLSFGKDGVVIKTTAGAVRQALEIDTEHLVCMVGVRYIDKDNEIAQVPGAPLNWIHFSTTKRKEFELEREVRLLYNDNDRTHKDKGIDLDVDLDKLILEIKVASSIPDYVFRLIRQEVTDAGLSVVPIKSDV